MKKLIFFAILIFVGNEIFAQCSQTCIDKCAKTVTNKSNPCRMEDNPNGRGSHWCQCNIGSVLAYD